MTTVSIIGIGNMGSAIAGIARKSGADVQVISRDAEKGAALAAATGATSALFGEPLTGELVVLAVPFSALEDILATYEGQLDGKVVVDISNPVDQTTFDGLVVPTDGSAAALIAEKVPGAKVLKAFNTNFAATLGGGSVAGAAPATVLVAGDDADAKAVLIELVRGAGLGADDAGSLKRARELEAMGYLQILLAVGEVVPWTGGFAIAK